MTGIQTSGSAGTTVVTLTVNLPEKRGAFASGGNPFAFQSREPFSEGSTIHAQFCSSAAFNPGHRLLCGINFPLYFSEWSTSYTPRDSVHDSYISAPYILTKLKASQGLAQGMSHWTYADLFKQPGPPTAPFQGGFGLMNPMAFASRRKHSSSVAN
jgi:hypothetical protein